MSDKKIIADSSFYLCFLDDIDRPGELVKIIDCFDFLLTPIVENEIMKSKNYRKIKNHKNIHSINFSFDFGKILRPMFSKEEIIKGEHEIIGVAYILYQLKVNFYFILDDGGARKFVLNNLTFLVNLMVGTIKFLAICCCSFGIFKKEESVNLLNLIEYSKFRVSKRILNETRQYIERC